MLRIALSHVTEGMELSLPVYHPYRSNSQLLVAGCVLSRSVIDRLTQLRVKDVWIRCPQLTGLSRYLTPELIAARRKLSEIICYVFEDFLAESSNCANLDEFSSIACELAAVAKRDLGRAVFLPCLSEGTDPLVRHAADTTVLSILISLRLNYHIDRQRRDVGLNASHHIEEIALGAMLHDIGLYMIPGGPARPDIESHHDPDAKWMEHTALGAQAVRAHVDPSVSAVVLHHHQHFDGSGFPQRSAGGDESSGLAAEHIPIYARVVAAADLLDELRMGTHGDRHSTAEALAALRRPPYRDWIDPVVHQAMLDAVAPIAPGSPVRLSSGEAGYVVAHHADDPFRPIVQIVVPADLRMGGKLNRRPTYDLRAEPDLRIVEADGFDVRDFTGASKPESHTDEQAA